LVEVSFPPGASVRAEPPTIEATVVAEMVDMTET
jgi:hypothetical protein